MKTLIGPREDSAGYTFEAFPDEAAFVQILHDLVAFVQMRVRRTYVERWPDEEGDGGEGLQVIVILTESDCIGNTYKWVDGKGRERVCTRVRLTSCKQFPRYEVRRFLRDRLGGARLLRDGWMRL